MSSLYSWLVLALLPTCVPSLSGCQPIQLADVQNASRSWEGLYQALFGTIKRQYGPDFSAEIDKLLMHPAGETDLLSYLLH